MKDYMARYNIKAIALTLLNLLLGTSAMASRGDYQVLSQWQSVDDMMISFMQENNIPGFSLAIVQAPYITRVVSYGLADTKTKQLAATRTMFGLGQMTNAYTAVAIMQLKEDGKLKLDDPIGKYIEEAPANWKSITIKDLLLHTSGLSDYTKTQGFNYTTDYKTTQVVGMLKALPVEFEPSTQQRYSATDHYLLGMVIEKVTGKKYEDFITERQIKPLGLQRTTFASRLKEVDNEVNASASFSKHSKFKHEAKYIDPSEVATGYVAKGDGLEQAPQRAWGATFADSGIYASSEDVSLWDIGLAGDILLKDPQSHELLYKAGQLKDGKIRASSSGWFFPGHKGLMLIKGMGGGYSSFLSRFTDPSELLCVTLLANKEGVAGLDVVARQIASAHDAKLGTPVGSEWAVVLQSPYSVDETIERAAAIIQKNGGKVFATIDHSAEAGKAGQKLRATKVIVVGNPAVGTAIMQAKQDIALDLPLKIASWQDEGGEVWISFTDPVSVAAHYKSGADRAVLKKIQGALLNVCHAAIGYN